MRNMTYLQHQRSASPLAVCGYDRKGAAWHQATVPTMFTCGR
jgi:hypothetical protein